MTTTLTEAGRENFKAQYEDKQTSVYHNVNVVGSKKNEWRVTIIDGSSTDEIEFAHSGTLDPDDRKHDVPFPREQWPDQFRGNGWTRLIGLDCVATFTESCNDSDTHSRAEALGPICGNSRDELPSRPSLKDDECEGETVSGVIDDFNDTGIVIR